jgi:methylisocitrate lyase
MADLGLAQLHDMKTNAEMIANLDPFGPPLIADMDTGYGGMGMENWNPKTRMSS